MPSSAPLILIADDSQVSREFMSNTLKAAGYNVIQAIDGGSALKVIHEHPVKVAIIDHFMAPHGGFDFAREVKNGKFNLPMIMVTNEETSDLLIETTRHGIGKYLRKPVDPKRLVETVRRSLREVQLDTPSPRPDVEIDLIHSPAELMSRAIELAHRNAQSRNGGPFGAVVADAEGHIIGEGVNGITSRCDPMAHAEVMAIRKATERLNRTDLEGCTLYCSSEPTTIGKSLIESVGLSKVYYGLSHSEVSQIRASRPRPPIPYEKLGHDEALTMLHEFENLGEAVKD
jgi:tRNA(Arg) A34 adenosine deaminase TadA/CheY-like chemotaxis protein